MLAEGRPGHGRILDGVNSLFRKGLVQLRIEELFQFPGHFLALGRRRGIDGASLGIFLGGLRRDVNAEVFNHGLLRLKHRLVIGIHARADVLLAGTRRLDDARPLRDEEPFPALLVQTFNPPLG